MEESHQTQPSEPVRKSLFTNIPPYLNYLPNGKVLVKLLNGMMIDFLLYRTSQRLAAALSTLTPWWT